MKVKHSNSVLAIWAAGLVGFGAVFGLEQLLPAASQMTAAAAVTAPQAPTDLSTVTPLFPSHIREANGDTLNRWWVMWWDLGDIKGRCHPSTEEPPSNKMGSPLESQHDLLNAGLVTNLVDKGDEVDVVDPHPNPDADALVAALGISDARNRFFRSDAACQAAVHIENIKTAEQILRRAAEDRKLDKYR